MTGPAAFVSRTHDPAFEPFLGMDGVQAGKVNRPRASEADGKVLKAGLRRCEPSTFPYPFTLDETFGMFEGNFIIQIAGGDRLELGPGDTASFLKGRSRPGRSPRPSYTASSSAVEDARASRHPAAGTRPRAASRPGCGR